MRVTRAVPALALAAAALGACSKPDQPGAGGPTDSLAVVRQQLLDEVVASTGFIADINKQLEKARVVPTGKPSETVDMRQVGEQRQEALNHITRLVAKLDSVQLRLTTARGQVANLSRRESGLVEQVAEFQKNIGELQASAEAQRAALQAVVDEQKGQIVALASKVDTLDRTRVALIDTVGQLTSQKNAAYVVIGTREELIKKGVLVAEGQKRFLVAGSRNIVPARKLDPAAFTKIDRRTDRTIVLPDGEYQILSRQNPEFATVSSTKPGKITGQLTIEQPEQFWESSPFLIIVRS